MFNANAVATDEFKVVGFVVSSGGAINSVSTVGEWELSSSIGQWEATDGRPLVSGPWSVTGGFWSPMPLKRHFDILFQDRFEANTIYPRAVNDHKLRDWRVFARAARTVVSAEPYPQH